MSTYFWFLTLVSSFAYRLSDEEGLFVPTTIQEEAKALLCNAVLPVLLEQLDYRGTGGRVGREGLVSCDVGGLDDYATHLGCVFS